MSILDYLPPLMADKPEVKEICGTEDKEFLKLRDAVVQAEHNSLIADADEQRIKDIEVMLDIVPTSSMTLEERKERLLKYLLEYTTYALAEVIDSISKASITGHIAYEVVYPDYEFNLWCDVPEYMWDIYLKKLQDILPANIIINAVNSAKSFAGQLYAGGITKTNTLRRIGF